MNAHNIEIVTYFYSRTGKQIQPLYVDGSLESFSSAKYGSQFIEDILSYILLKSVNCTVTSDSADGLDCSAHFSVNTKEVNIHFRRNNTPCSIKEKDCWRLNDGMEKVEWFIHHITINNKYFDDMLAAKEYVMQIISSIETDPTSAAVA